MIPMTETLISKIGNFDFLIFCLHISCAKYNALFVDGYCSMFISHGFIMTKKISEVRHFSDNVA